MTAHAEHGEDAQRRVGPTPLVVVSPETTDIASPKGETRQRLLRIIQQLLPGAIAQARAGTISPLLDDSDNDSDEPLKAKVIVDEGLKRKHDDTKSTIASTPPQKKAKNVLLRKLLSTGGPIVCHNCGEEGHVKPACPNPKRACRGCGKSGHMIKFCHSTNNPGFRPHKKASKQKRDSQVKLVEECVLEFS